jgi:acetyl esterase/lipase
MMLPRLAAAWLVLMLAGCAEWWPEPIVVERGLVYRTVGDEQLRLDLARPRGEGPFPAIVFIHGGGWVQGRRESFADAIEEAARRGYVATTITYRLARPDPETDRPRHPFPAQLDDCRAAVRWLRTHAPEYRVDPARVGVLGESAGGHLGLLVGLATADDAPGLADDAGGSSRVQAVVGVSGPTDLLRWYETAPVMRGYARALCDGPPDTARETYVQASPVTWVSAAAPPILLQHGQEDEAIPFEQATLLAARLEAAGVPHVLTLFPEQGHGFHGAAATQAEAAQWAFFDEHLKQAPTAH